MKTDAASGILHPRQAKVDLAIRIITDFDSARAAHDAAQEFERRFVEKALPSDLVEKTVSISDEGLRVTRLIMLCGLAASSTAATRLINQGSVRIDGEKVSNRFLAIDAEREPFVLQVGKRKVVRIRPVKA